MRSDRWTIHPSDPSPCDLLFLRECRYEPADRTKTSAAHATRKHGVLRNFLRKFFGLPLGRRCDNNGWILVTNRATWSAWRIARFSPASSRAVCWRSRSRPSPRRSRRAIWLTSRSPILPTPATTRDGRWPFHMSEGPPTSSQWRSHLLRTWQGTRPMADMHKRQRASPFTRATISVPFSACNTFARALSVHR